jgi:hypothetical protein
MTACEAGFNLINIKWYNTDNFLRPTKVTLFPNCHQECISWYYLTLYGYAARLILPFPPLCASKLTSIILPCFTETVFLLPPTWDDVVSISNLLCPADSSQNTRSNKHPRSWNPFILWFGSLASDRNSTWFLCRIRIACLPFRARRCHFYPSFGTSFPSLLKLPLKGPAHLKPIWRRYRKSIIIDSIKDFRN